MHDASNSDDWQAQAQSLRALAISLVGSSQAADDLLQETWVRALERGPSGLASPAAWLKAVVRNLVRDSARGAAHEADRRRDAAKPEAMASDAVVLEQLEVLKSVADELAQLPEHYRATLHARFFEGVELAEIARRTGLSLEAARSRQKRGLELMRERLDRRSRGDRSVWLAALAPLVRPQAATAAPAKPLLAYGGLLGAQLAALAVLVGCAIALAVLWSSTAAREGGSQLGATAGTPETLATDDAQVAEQGFERVATATDAVAPASASESPVAGSAAPAELRGSLVVLDELGREWRDESGEFTLFFGPKLGELDDLEVRVERGSWSARVPAGSLLRFDDLVVGERCTAFADNAVRTAGSESIELVGRWFAPIALHVRDAVTGLELRDVEVRLQTTGEPTLTHPGDGAYSKVLVSKGLSPLSIEARERLAVYFAQRGWPPRHFVHAPGYAWQCVALDFQRGDDRVVELVPGGEIEVLVDDHGPVDVHVVGIDESPFHANAVAQAQCARGRLLLGDLGAGAYWIGATANNASTRVEYTRQRIQLEPGARVTLKLVPATRIDTAALTVAVGTLRLREVLPEHATALRLVRVLPRVAQQPTREIALASMRVDERDALLSHWSAELEPGTWEARLETLGFAHEFAIEPGAEQRVAIELPPLARVTVRVIDAETGAPLVAEQVTLNPRYAGEMRLRILAPSADSGVYTGVAPVGECWLSVAGTDRRPLSRHVELQPGENALTAELAIARGIDLDAFVAATRESLQLDPGGDFAIEFAGQSFGGWLMTSNAGGTPRFFLGDAGRYTLSFAPRDGLETPATVVVDVPVQGFVEIRVPFERAR